MASEKRHLVIPDCQVKPGVPTDHLIACGNYIVEKMPDVIVCLGDFADMPSLSTHDTAGSMKREMKRYQKDLDAAYAGMEKLMLPVQNAVGFGYEPRMVMLLGNHEDRIDRAVTADPRWEGRVSTDDLRYEEFGWEVHPFLKPVKIDGIMYCHYFPSGVMGRPITSASRILSKYHQSCIAGHQQGRDIAYSRKADGKTLTAIIAGSFYEHKEDYLTPITNSHWRGVYMLNEVHGGSFDEMPISLNYLKKRYL